MYVRRTHARVPVPQTVLCRSNAGRIHAFTAENRAVLRRGGSFGEGQVSNIMSIAHANAPAALAPGVARHNRARIQRARAIWLNNALPSKWLIARESSPSIGATMALPGETEAGNAEKQSW
jgi:hypothetical protein